MNTITILETKYLALKKQADIGRRVLEVLQETTSLPILDFSDMEEESLHDYKNPARVKKAIARARQDYKAGKFLSKL
ncbi:MAG: hypothetical protein AAB410_02575 [Patescibacteria group bacterium]